MSKPNHELRFCNKENKSFTMPIVVTDQQGTRIGMTGSYNSFDSKEQVNKFIAANKTLAKQFRLETKYDEALKNFELVREVSYVTKISL